jgi:broad specificity phosphatase PhoE
MTIIHLVRHAVHDLVAHVLVGRNQDVRLSATGLQQSRALAADFAAEAIACVQSSPQPRAWQTAQPIATSRGCAVEIVPALDELDMGAWTGRTFADLDGDPFWQQWNSARGNARPPDGESMGELQVRLLQHLRRTRQKHPDGRIVMVTHAEAIRAAVLHALAWPLDAFGRLQIDPASVTTLGSDGETFRALSINRSVGEVVAA